MSSVPIIAGVDINQHLNGHQKMHRGSEAHQALTLGGLRQGQGLSVYFASHDRSTR